MMRRFFVSATITSLLLSAYPVQANIDTDFNPHFLVSDEDFLDVKGMDLPTLQSFLASRGTLGNYRVIDRDGTERSAAEVILRYSGLYGINPKFILVLLQREQSLVEHANPSQNQLDWALGYAICDDCAKNDPLLQKYRGFANQVYYAAKRIRESYLADLDLRGQTISGVGPNIPGLIDGQTVIPANLATAVLYTYTPHLHGNKNFVRIWNRWFTPNYPHGSLLQDVDSGGIYLIHFGTKRPITSRAAFYSRFNPQTLIPVTAATLSSYDDGSAISFPNYSLLKAPNNNVYLLVDDDLRWIPDMETFRTIGFNTDEIVDVSEVDIASYRIGTPLSAEMAHPKGALVQNPANGGVFYIEAGVRHPIYSRQILNARYGHLPILAGSTAEIEQFHEGDAVKFPDGALIAAHGSPDVFVVSNGRRRHITDEAVFLQYGWEWDRIIWTNERAVLAHLLGEPLEIEKAEEAWGEISTASF